ncbi:MAG: cysteine desulfurase family protein [Vulcanimicrobiaceae bacterium]
MREQRIYADHAATTPMRAEAVAAMVPWLEAGGFNPSSLHAEGRRARAALDDARERIAALLGVRPDEIVFTAGGSEADVLALVGAVRARRRQTGAAHVVSVASEHHAVLHALALLASEGVAVTLLGVDAQGRLDLAELAAALRPETVLVSAMLANNEIGTVGPLAEIATLAHARGVLVHCDAVQAAGRLPLDVPLLGADLLALAAHKCYGPKGVGLLAVRNGVALEPLVVGGGQERGRRAGTENVAGIVAFARALELAEAERHEEAARLERIRAQFEAELLATVPGACIVGGEAARVAHISSVAFRGCDASELLVALDLAGVAASAGSACASGVAEPSHVLAALGLPPALARGTVRFSFGRLTGEDAPRLAGLVRAAVEAQRAGEADLGRGNDSLPLRHPEVSA